MGRRQPGSQLDASPAQDPWLETRWQVRTGQSIKLPKVVSLVIQRLEVKVGSLECRGMAGHFPPNLATDFLFIPT